MWFTVRITCLATAIMGGVAVSVLMFPNDGSVQYQWVLSGLVVFWFLLFLTMAIVNIVRTAIAESKKRAPSTSQGEDMHRYFVAFAVTCPFPVNGTANHTFQNQLIDLEKPIESMNDIAKLEEKLSGIIRGERGGARKVSLLSFNLMPSPHGAF